MLSGGGGGVITSVHRCQVSSVLGQIIFQLFDLLADLQSRPQLDAHSRHQVVGLQQHQGLAVNLLQSEVLHVVGAAGQLLDEVADLLDIPLERVVLRTGQQTAGGTGSLGGRGYTGGVH